MSPNKSLRRKFFDLTPAELSELSSLDHGVSFYKRNVDKPPRMRARVYEGSTEDYQIDSHYYDLTVYGVQMAVEKRKRWLQENHISEYLARQVRRADYKTYENAALVGKVAPPVPDWYRKQL